MNRHEAELIVAEWESRRDEIVLAGDRFVLPNHETTLPGGDIVYSNGSVKRWTLQGGHIVLDEALYRSALNLLEKIGEPAISDRMERGYLEVIAALTKALTEELPELKKANDSINVGYSKDTGDAGVVGHLIKGGFTKLRGEAIRKKIDSALKLK